jgi:hypothetical protein
MAAGARFIIKGTTSVPDEGRKISALAIALCTLGLFKAGPQRVQGIEGVSRR